jgi:hypothetical protein
MMKPSWRKRVEEATEKQINALRKFAKNPGLSRGLLRNLQ